ncbi:cysteine--tRNA ligase [Patescibacteria group bacterium]|nr:cysteine--tRNA ligase [Patescibacteria group bacterium]
MLRVYNTLSQKKEIFKSKRKRVHPVKSFAGGKRKSKILFNRVNLFVCGPTVYDLSHIGHARTYIVFDILVKYLREAGYNVFYLQNITDIDDKIISRAKEKKISWKELTRKFEKEYFKDMRTLNVTSVTKYARATAYIKEIISQVERLEKKDFAYQIKDGIYYDISKFKDYGKLSRRKALQAEDAVSRIDENIDKRNRGDFCLWKFSKPGEPKWLFASAQDRSAAQMDGRPGWHIEDTAITEKFFGPQYDIHGGARDLIFPHHEAEISQMEAISGKKPLVRYWFHTGFLTVRGEKMAKSLGNFITIKEFLKKYPARVLRLFIIKAHYRSPIDYTENAISQTVKELEKIDEFTEKIQNLNVKCQIKSKIQISKYQTEFKRAMEDDFNTPKAIAAIFALINEGNSLIAKNKMTSDLAREIIEFLKGIDKFFNFIFWKKTKEKIPKEVLKLVKEREGERKKGNFEKADEIRKKIKDKGFWVEDGKQGPKLKKISNF